MRIMNILENIEEICTNCLTIKGCKSVHKLDNHNTEDPLSCPRGWIIINGINTGKVYRPESHKLLKIENECIQLCGEEYAKVCDEDCTLKTAPTGDS